MSEPKMNIEEVKSILNAFTRTSKDIVNPDFPGYYTETWEYKDIKLVNHYGASHFTKSIYKGEKLMHLIEQGFSVSATELAMMIKPLVYGSNADTRLVFQNLVVTEPQFNTLTRLNQDEPLTCSFRDNDVKVVQWSSQFKCYKTFYVTPEGKIGIGF